MLYIEKRKWLLLAKEAHCVCMKLMARNKMYVEEEEEEEEEEDNNDDLVVVVVEV